MDFAKIKVNIEFRIIAHLKMEGRRQILFF
jgi:hypothetical protein